MGLWAKVKLSASERLARNWSPTAQPSRASRPIVSFTFDDFPASARTAGAAVLAARGVRGSFYVSGRFEGVQEDGIQYFGREDLIALAEDGHEIGCHTFGHVRLPDADKETIDADLRRNAAYVDEVLPGYRMESFAYPFGHVNVSKKAFIGRYFDVSRGIFPGVNEGRIDFQQLRSIPLEQRSFDREAALRTLEAAAERRGWTTFFTHDVSATPSPYGCTPDELARLVDDVQARGFEVMTVRDAAVAARSGALPQEA